MVRIWDLVDKYMLVVSVFIAFKGNLIKKKNLVKKTWKTWKNKQTLPATAFKFLEVFAALFYFLNRYDLAQQSLFRRTALPITYIHCHMWDEIWNHYCQVTIKFFVSLLYVSLVGQLSLTFALVQFESHWNEYDWKSFPKMGSKYSTSF